MPMAAQGGWKPVPRTEPRDAFLDMTDNADGGDRVVPGAPRDLPTNANIVH